jgi:FAD/FMN-containing dehydrogenase
MNIDRRSFVNATLMGAASALVLPGRGWADGAGSGASAAGIAARTSSGKSISLTASDIKDLDTSLRGDLIRPGDGGYDSARRLWNPAFDRHPALIARCRGAADVVAAVQFARTHELLTAVRGGGHSLSGQSGCDGGFVIDLSSMKGIRVDPRTLRADAQPGVLLGEFDQETQAFGLATTLGTAPDTGLAGLTLGGGFGRLDRSFGLACDNLRSVDIVTADGKLRHASTQENPDLYWGVRGGGGNFGIVTSFEYELHAVGPKLLAGYRAFPLQKAGSVLTALMEFAETMPDEMYVSVDVGRWDKQPTVGYEVVYNGAPSEGKRLLARLQQLGTPVYDTVAVKTYVAAQGGTGKVSGAPSEKVIYYKSGFVGDLSSKLIDQIVRRFESSPTPVEGLVLFRHGGAAGRVKPDATAFWNRWMKYTLLLIGSWDTSQNDESVKTARAFWGGLEPFTRNYYINTDVYEGEQRLRATYGDNYPRLVKLKDKYDPTNLFRLNANIMPTGRA